MFGTITAGQTYAQQFNYNFDSLKRVINKNPNDTRSAKAYIDYAAKFFYVKSDSGLYYLDKGIALAQRGSDKFVYLFAIKNKADYTSISGDFKTAAQIYKQGLNIPAGPNNWLIKEKMRGNLGIAYKNMGMLDSALIQYQIVNQIFATHTKNHQDSVAMAFSYMQLYDLYQVQGLLDEAIYYGEKGYQLSLALQFERGIAYGFFIRALKYQHSNPALALQYTDRSLNMAVQKNIPELQQFNRGLKARILIAQRKYLEAKSVLERGSAFTAGSAQQVTYAHLAEVYYYLNDLPKALTYFKKSYQMAISSGYHSELADALKSGIAIYEKLGDYKKAYLLQQEYQQVQNKIASAKLRLDAQRSAIKFKTAEKDQQLTQKQLLIARQENRLNRQSLLISVAGIVVLLITALIMWHLYQQRKLKKQQDIAIKATNELHVLEAMMRGEETERRRIAKDLHDGLGGILSAVKMRFSLFKNEIPELNTSASFNQAMHMLDEASAEIRKTAHNLMPDILTKFGLDDAVQAYCDKMSVHNKLVLNYQSVGNIGRFHEEFELSVYRIIQELLNNIIKHAQAGRALVQFAEHDILLTVSIEDDGKGFDLGQARLGSGMGLNSVKSRVQALQGTIDIDSAPGKGTAIYMEFDIKRFAKTDKLVI